jgi:malonyl-CoA O-methyltransferase
LRPDDSRSPWLHEEVAQRMAERLDWITRRPAHWAHWGPLQGGLEGHERVASRYPEASCHVVEADAERSRRAMERLAKPWWHPGRWRAAPVHAGLPPVGGVQMVWANMLLHQQADPQALLEQWRRALDVDGFLMFSCLGPDTVRELRAVYRALGWPAPAHDFTDMHDWGDMLVEAGFAEPVMDMERITLSFETPQRLLQELRGLGRNLHPGRFAGLRGRAWLAHLQTALTEGLARADESGRLVVTFEVIYGHAFRAAPRAPMAAETRVPLDELRLGLRQRKKNPPFH